MTKPEAGRSSGPRSRSVSADDSPAAARLAVGYLRVSSVEQDREGFSIPAQRKLLDAYAAAHSLAIVELFIDVETAKRAGRKHFNG